MSIPNENDKYIEDMKALVDRDKPLITLQNLTIMR